MGFLDILGSLFEKVSDAKDKYESDYYSGQDREQRKLNSMSEEEKIQYLKQQSKKGSQNISGRTRAERQGRMRAMIDEKNDIIEQRKAK
jgi:hypothetical protein